MLEHLIILAIASYLTLTYDLQAVKSTCPNKDTAIAYAVANSG